MEKRELTEQEIRELLQGIIEDSRKYPPKVTVAKCNSCKHRVPMTATCKLYPRMIPKPILLNKEACPEFSQIEGKPVQNP